MGFKLVALSSLLLTVSALSVEKNAVGGGCVEMLCPETASHFGLRNLVNEDTLKTDACTACTQCTENGYSVCLRPKDSRASRTAGGCSCAHSLAANCHTDLSQTHHPANLTMKPYTACYSDALQRPPQPLAVNENSSIVVTIEPFWLEPYWRHLKIENVTLHYKFIVNAPEHCEGEVVSTSSGVHTCLASVLVDLSESKEDQPQAKDDDDYDHSDNYDQYDDDLPPEVQFDRDVFSGARELEAYYTATARRPRQIKASASKDQQIYDGETLIESEHMTFDLKPEVYGMGETEIVASPPEAPRAPFDPEESATVVEEENDEGDVSEETGGTNFFEEEEKKEEEAKKTEESDEKDEEEGVLKVNLEDIEPTKLKSQEEAKKKVEEEGDDDEKKEEEPTTTASDKEEEKEEEKKEGGSEEEKNDEEKKDDEEKNEDDEEETTEESTTVAGDEEEKDESSEEDSEEKTTVETVEGESQNFLDRFFASHDYPRVRTISLATLGFFIIFTSLALCILYRKKCCCCQTKESKTSNGYRYTSANPPPQELKQVSRAPSGVAADDQQRLLEDGEALDNFRAVVRSGTTFNPSKVELGVSVGVGRFGPIYSAMFNSYNGSVHDVNVYMLKNVTRLTDERLVELTSLLKANISAGAHQNVVSLCGISQAGSDVMLMWEPLHQSVLRGVLRESRCARFGTEPFNMASFLSSERLAAIAIGCCNGVEHLLKKNVFPSHLSTSNVLLAERGIVKIGGFGLAEHHALEMSTESAPTKLRWMPPEYFKRDQKMLHNEQTLIWPLGVTLWEIFSLGGTPFASLRQVQTFIDAMRDGSAHLDPITYCGEAVTQLLATCTTHVPEARGDIRTIIKRLECISADAKTQINLCYREDFPYLPIVTQLEQQIE